MNEIGRDGVALAPRQIVATEPNAHAIVVDPTNRRLLVPCLGGDALLSLGFDESSGSISEADRFAVRTAVKAGPRHLRFHPNGRLLCLLNELDATINTYDHDEGSGALSLIQTISILPAGFSGKPWAADIHVTPDGRFAYASERTSNTLAMFRVDERSGRLSLIDHITTERQPRAFAIDPTGRYLLAVGELSNSMTSYAIDRTSGRLTVAQRHPVSESPNWVEIIALR